MNFLDCLYYYIIHNNNFIVIMTLIFFTFAFNYFLTKVTINLFNLKISRKRQLIFWAVTSIVNSISRIYVPIQYFRIISILTLIICMYYILSKNVEIIVISNVLNSVLLVTGEIIFLNIFKILYPINNYKYDIYVTMYRLLSLIFITLLFTIVFFIIRKFNLKIDLKNVSSSKNKKMIILEGIVCCNIIFLNSLGLVFLENKFIIPIAIMNIIVLGYYYLKDATKVNKIDASNLKIENLEFYNNNLNVMYDEIRSFKHDFGNIIQAMGGYIKTDNLEGLKKMYEKIQTGLNEMNNIEILNPDIINDPAVYNILNTKYYTAKNYGVEMDIEVMLDLKELNVDILDFCRIFGILLDNAIEAAKECEKKEVCIKFHNDSKRNRNLIIIENTYKNRDVDIDKIFDKEYTSKTEKNSHGLGLWRVKKILDKNKNLSLYSSKGVKFVQQLEVYNSKVLTKV